MANKTIYVIVPRLPPAVDGLGDYGHLLGRELQRHYPINIHFIVGDPSWKGSLSEFPVSTVASRTSESLKKLLPGEGDVFLHYVGYGYAKRGCPGWLIDALKDWKKKSNTKRRLLTMFHECYAFGPAWTSQFWTSPYQRFLLKELINTTDMCFTSKNSYSAIIKKYSSDKKINVPVIPVFSNVGEALISTQLSERDNAMVVFGGKAWRKKAFVESEEQLLKVIQDLKIKKVFDIGSELNFIPNVGQAQFFKMGALPADEISALLLKSKYGFLNYPADYLSKSGIFASYCSHGLLPINANDNSRSDDGARAGIEYLSAKEINSSVDPEHLQVIASNALTWYRGHNLETQAKTFGGFILEN